VLEGAIPSQSISPATPKQRLALDSRAQSGTWPGRSELMSRTGRCVSCRRHFINTFKVGGGLLADVKKDSSSRPKSTKVNARYGCPPASCRSGLHPSDAATQLQRKPEGRVLGLPEVQSTSTILRELPSRSRKTHPRNPCTSTVTHLKSKL